MRYFWVNCNCLSILWNGHERMQIISLSDFKSDLCISAIGVGYSAVEFLLHIILLSGIYMRRPTWLLFHLWAQASLLVVTVVLILIYLFIDALFALLIFIPWPFFFYCFICIKSLYQEMNECWVGLLLKGNAKNIRNTEDRKSVV